MQTNNPASKDPAKNDTLIGFDRQIIGRAEQNIPSNNHGHMTSYSGSEIGTATKQLKKECDFERPRHFMTLMHTTLALLSKMVSLNLILMITGIA